MRKEIFPIYNLENRTQTAEITQPGNGRLGIHRPCLVPASFPAPGHITLCALVPAWCSGTCGADDDPGEGSQGLRSLQPNLDQVGDASVTDGGGVADTGDDSNSQGVDTWTVLRLYLCQLI